MPFHVFPAEWKQPPRSLALSPGEVQIWRACREWFDPAPWRALLDADELIRADRFRFDQHRDRFILWRGILRTVLGACTGVASAEVRFRYSAEGKPALDHPATDIRFNLTHSHDWMVLACGRDAEIGVDIERNDPRLQIEAIARRYFTEAEQEKILTLTGPDRLKQFLQIWTGREAVLKAEGVGLASLASAAEMVAHWKLIPFTPTPGYTGCLALPNGYQPGAFFDFPGLPGYG